MSMFALRHSQGSWKEHKYIKKENGTYVYPGDQSDVKPSNSDLSKIDTSNVNIDKKNMVDIANDKLDNKGTEQIAKLLIGGLYGDSKKAKEMLGKNYESIAKKADELIKNDKVDPSDVKKGMENANVLIAALSKMDLGKTSNKSASKNSSTASSEDTKTNGKTDSIKNIKGNKTSSNKPKRVNNPTIGGTNISFGIDAKGRFVANKKR